jgi:heterodisulfide reductase subunit A
MEGPRIGVYICRCGGNISNTVDVEKVRDTVEACPGVEVAKTYEYMCSKPGQDMIERDIREKGLNRVVVAACSPRMHRDTFRRAAERGGLNPYLSEMANIREQCSWVHSERESATEKAISLIRGTVERAQHLGPLESKTMQVRKDVLVIGGGIAGILASIELADKGYQVYLVERNPSIGGRMAQLSKTFPTLDCSACILTPKMVHASQHKNVKILDMAEVAEVEGSPGNYRIKVSIRPRYVDRERCISCGDCARVCPVKRPSGFEEGLTQEKAIYIPFQQAVPNAYVIDGESCLFFKKGACRLCEKECRAGAIAFDQGEETVELDVGAIVVCTGYRLLDQVLSKEILSVDVFGQYGYGLHPDIVTNLQFERLLVQGMHRPSNGRAPKRVAFILCVGSRMDRGVTHCCNIGCMVAIKQTILLLKEVPDAEPWVFYTDIRAQGKGCEEFYAHARGENVRFIRGRAAEVIPRGESLIVRAEDTILGRQMEEDFDMVVLTPAILSNSGNERLGKTLGIDRGPDGFFLESHYKMKPVETRMEGIFLAGCALGPKDIRETAIEAAATASKVATFLGRGEVPVSPEKGYIMPEGCNACGDCIESCPVNAIEPTAEGVVIDPMRCIGCGICIPRCPTGAIDLRHSTEAQFISQIGGTVEPEGERPQIIAFLEKTTAYGSADLAGQKRVGYTPNVRVIAVPSTGRVGLRHLLHAFSAGADGVILLEGDDSPFRKEMMREHVNLLKKELGRLGIEPLRLIPATTTLPQYEKVVDLFEAFNERIMKMGRIPADRRRGIQKGLEGNDER